MIDPKAFFDALSEKGVSFYAGVPDSLLKHFNAYVMDHAEQHTITANEGGAVALAAGYHLVTGKTGVVYMQNSGQGNAVNPLTSLVDPDVYRIPVLLVIGWRGEPGVKDEPQHAKQGKITLKLLETLGIPYAVLPATMEDVLPVLDEAFSSMKQRNAPYALVVTRGAFDAYTIKNTTETSFPLSREEATGQVLEDLGDEDVVVSTTGKTSREVFEYRTRRKQNHSTDFLTVGCMGHASQIALGISLATDRRVFCLDGDGAVLMHMGSLAIIGKHANGNFVHVVLNNGAHDSVGGQPTVALDIDLPAIAKACGYKRAVTVSSVEEIKKVLVDFQDAEGPVFLEIKVRKGARKDLGRPTSTPIENKEGFMNFLG